MFWSLGAEYLPNNGQSSSDTNILQIGDTLQRIEHFWGVRKGVDRCLQCSILHNKAPWQIMARDGAGRFLRAWTPNKKLTSDKSQKKTEGRRK